MGPNESQISKWLKRARKGAGLTQSDAVPKSGVGYGVITASEQGRDIMTTNFLALVLAYGAEDALAAQIKQWRRTDAIPVAPIEAFEPVDLSKKKKRRAGGKR